DRVAVGPPRRPARLKVGVDREARGVRSPPHLLELARRDIRDVHLPRTSLQIERVLERDLLAVWRPRQLHLRPRERRRQLPRRARPHVADKDRHRPIRVSRIRQRLPIRRPRRIRLIELVARQRLRLVPDLHQPQLVQRDERHLLSVRRQRWTDYAHSPLLGRRREVVTLHRIRSPSERHPRRERDIRHRARRHIPPPDLPVRRINQRVIRQPRSREREHILIARHRLAIHEQLRQRPPIHARRPPRTCAALPHVRKVLSI